GAVGAAQQGRYHDGHASRRSLFGPAARRSPRRARALLPQRVPRKAVRSPAPARAQGLSRHARRPVSARAHGTALGQGTIEEGGAMIFSHGLAVASPPRRKTPPALLSGAPLTPPTLHCG